MNPEFVLNCLEKMREKFRESDNITLMMWTGDSAWTSHDRLICTGTRKSCEFALQGNCAKYADCDFTYTSEVDFSQLR